MTSDVLAAARRRYAAKAYAPDQRLAEGVLQQLQEVLRLSPSSVNCQPWHFVVAGSREARARVAKATDAAAAYNTPKILAASQVIVLCVRTDLEDGYLERVLAQEERDGRFAHAESKAMQSRARRGYVQIHRDLGDVQSWGEKQVYLALGALLLAAGGLQVDATPIEGFDAAVLDEELGLSARGLHSLVLVALGRRAESDPNAVLPKSRLPREEVFTFL